MIEYYDNDTLCINGGWLIGEGILSEMNYKALLRRNKMKRVQLGGNGRPALIEYDSIPERFKQKIIKKIGDPRKIEKYRFFRKYLVADTAAKEYYGNYMLESGDYLPEKTVREYTINAMFLKALHIIYNDMSARRKTAGGNQGGIWQQLSKIINTLKQEDQYKYLTLPANYIRLKQKVNDFNKEGYKFLIHRNFGNQSSRKVNEKLERLILSLYAMENNPFAERVLELYAEFLNLKLMLIDKATGELFDTKDFSKNNKPILISIATIHNYIHNPDNQRKVDKLRKSASDYTMANTPFVRRSLPDFAGSMISMDDRTLPRKGDDKWINGYFAMDVASGAYIAKTYTYDKPTIETVLECFRDMYRTIITNNLYWPAECEVEHFLMKSIEDKLNDMFTYVRFCNPANSREKSMEHGFRAKKYTDEKKYQKGIERWYGRGVYKKNQDIKQKLTKEQVVADDIESINRHNNSLHPNQKLYKNMTRWDVFLNRQHPDLYRPQKFRLFKHIGYYTETSITNNNEVQVQGETYWIDFDILKRLRNKRLNTIKLKDKSTRYAIDAYWLPDENGIIHEVFLYQNDTFLCKAEKVDKFQKARIEQTQDDKDIMLAHQKRGAQFRKQVKDGIEEKITPLEFVEKKFDKYENIKAEEYKPVTVKQKEADKWDELADMDHSDYAEKAYEDI